MIDIKATGKSSMTPETFPIDPQEATRRIEQYFQLYALNMRLVEAGVRLDYPEASSNEVHQRMAERLRVVRQEKWKGHGPSDHRHR